MPNLLDNDSSGNPFLSGPQAPTTLRGLEARLAATPKLLPPYQQPQNRIQKGRTDRGLDSKCLLGTHTSNPLYFKITRDKATSAPSKIEPGSNLSTTSRVAVE